MSMSHAKELTERHIHFRWMIRSDWEQVEAIDRQLLWPWGMVQLMEHLRRRNVIARVAECRVTGEILGCQLSGLEKNRVELLYLAVKQDAPPVQYRRRGVGSLMVDSVKSRTSATSRSSIWCYVPADLVDLQLMLRDQDFLAVQIDRQYDRYVMRWLHPQTQGTEI